MIRDENRPAGHGTTPAAEQQSPATRDIARSAIDRKAGVEGYIGQRGEHVRERGKLSPRRDPDLRLS